MRRRAVISTFGASGLSIALSLVTSIVVARSLGPEGRGALLVFTFWPALLVGLLGLSINEATAYHVASAAAGPGAGMVRAFMASGLAIQIAAAAAAAVASLAVLPAVLPGAYQAGLAGMLWYAAAFIPLSALDQHFKAVLQGAGRFRALNALRLAQPCAYAFGLLCLAALHGMRVEAVMAVMIAALAVSAASGAWFAGVSLAAASRATVRATLATGWRFHVANVLLFAAAEADKLIVLQIMDNTRIGYYAVATAVSALGSGLVVQSLGQMLTRDMAAASPGPEQRAVFIANSQAALVLLAIVNGSAAALAPLWLPVLFGREFEGAVPVAAILLFAGAIKGLRNIMDRAMRAARNTKVGIAGEAAALAALLVAAPLGERLGGLEGFAWGIAAAQACSLAVMVAMAARRLGVDVRELSPLHRDNLARAGGFARREWQLARGWWR